MESEINQLSPDVKPSRKVRKVRVMSEKMKFPSIPIRGLWDRAPQEDQARARQISQVMMEYWMGRLSKKEAMERLQMKPVRFWQMSTQAIAGMTAGLLTQPRYRKSSYLASDEVTRLRAQVRELEAKVSAQQKLIEVLKSLPGYQGEVTNARTAKPGVQRRGKGPRGTKLEDCAKRQSTNDVSGSKCDSQNVKVMEEAGLGGQAPA